MAAAKDEKKKEPTQQKTRMYSIFALREIDLTDQESIDKIKEEFGEDPIEVMIRIAGVDQSTPQRAIEVVGKNKDLDGRMGVVSDNSVTEYSVKTKQERVVSFE